MPTTLASPTATPLDIPYPCVRVALTEREARALIRACDLMVQVFGPVAAIHGRNVGTGTLRRVRRLLAEQLAAVTLGAPDRPAERLRRSSTFGAPVEQSKIAPR
jgi:hypothetical protein